MIAFTAQDMLPEDGTRGALLPVDGGLTLM
jgi:hypothetical protein